MIYPTCLLSHGNRFVLTALHLTYFFYLSYTMLKAFSKMINEVNDLAGQRELISEYLEAEVCVCVGGLYTCICEGPYLVSNFYNIM